MGHAHGRPPPSWSPAAPCCAAEGPGPGVGNVGWGGYAPAAKGCGDRRQGTRCRGAVVAVRGPSPAACGVGGCFGGEGRGGGAGAGPDPRRAPRGASGLAPAHGTVPVTAASLGASPAAETPWLGLSPGRHTPRHGCACWPPSVAASPSLSPWCTYEGGSGRGGGAGWALGKQSRQVRPL